MSRGDGREKHLVIKTHIFRSEVLFVGHLTQFSAKSGAGYGKMRVFGGVIIF